MFYNYYGVYNETTFDGEGPLTAAADSVLTDAAPDSVNLLPGGSIWALLFILVISEALPVFGFVRWMRRRKL